MYKNCVVSPAIIYNDIIQGTTVPLPQNLHGDLRALVKTLAGLY